MLRLSVFERKIIIPESTNWWQAEIAHPVGTLHIVGLDDALVGLGLGYQTKPIQNYINKHEINCTPHRLSLDSLSDFTKIVTLGTPFQTAVWQALLEIPCGTVQTYSDLANRIGRPKALRAVGTAVGANPVTLLIPCHRVIPKSGGIGQYYWGSNIKQQLLDMEGVWL